jgi:hypothetical protein
VFLNIHVSIWRRNCLLPHVQDYLNIILCKSGESSSSRFRGNSVSKWNGVGRAGTGIRPKQASLQWAADEAEGASCSDNRQCSADGRLSRYSQESWTDRLLAGSKRTEGGPT